MAVGLVYRWTPPRCIDLEAPPVEHPLGAMGHAGTGRMSRLLRPCHRSDRVVASTPMQIASLAKGTETNRRRASSTAGEVVLLFNGGCAV